MLASLVNVGTASDVVFELPSGGSSVVLEDDGTSGNGISRLRSTNGTFDPTTFTNPSGSLTIRRGDAADGLTVNALPDFTAGLFLGSAAGPLATVTFAGLLTLGADKSLSVYASGTIGVQGGQLQTSGSGSIALSTARNIALSGISGITTVDGNLTLSANQQAVPTAGSFAGIDVARGTVQVTGTGNLAFFGRGGGALSTSNHGIQLSHGAVVRSTSAAVGAGTITLQGTVGEGSQSSAGVALFNDQTSVTSVRGNISITGLPANTAASTNWGIMVGTDASISSTGLATISLTGTGGVGLFNNDGIVVAGELKSAIGDMTLTGYGGTSRGGDDNDGIEILGTIESTGTANVTIVGRGGSGSFNNQGVQLEGLVKSASGKITVTGTGGQGDRFNNGFFTEGTAAKIQTVDGDISISGIAGAATSGPFSAVGIGGAGVESTGRGAISISGSGGLNSYAVVLSGPIKSASPVQITGAGGSAACGILAQGGIDTSLTGADIKLTADCLRIGTQPINAGHGSVSIRPLTAGYGIDLGGSDASGSLGITDAELDAITAGSLQIGDASSGPITVSAEITPAATSNVRLTSGSSISLPNAASRLSASGNGAISLTAARDISLASGSSITTVDGAITLAANRQTTSTTGNFIGVDVNGGTLRATGMGAVSVQGKGGSVGGNQVGVRVGSSGLIQGGNNGLEIVGVGGDTSASGGNAGVLVESKGQVSASDGGAVTVQGIGGTGPSGANAGVRVTDSGSAITSSGGSVRVTGQGGISASLGFNIGVYLDGAPISAEGTGAVIIHGTSGTNAGLGGMNEGVLVWFTTVSSAAGDVEIIGQGGGSSVSGNNNGVELYSGHVKAGGEGAVNIQGTGGGTGGNANHGVWLTSSSDIATETGKIEITGQGGGTGTSQSSYGVLIQGRILAGGTGDVIVQGTGGAGSGGSNLGFFLSSGGGSITSSGGSVEVTGVEGSGPSSLGITLDRGGISAASPGGSVALIGNSMLISSDAGASVGTSGVVTIRPFKNGTSIDLGLATDAVAGPLALTDSELGQITAGTIQIGDASSGPITVSAPLTLAGRNLTLVTGAGVSASQPIVNGSPTAVMLTIDQAGDSTYSGRLGGDESGTAEDQNLAFTKRGAGTLTLSGFNRYSGPTNIVEGTLSAVSDKTIPDTSDVTIASGATLNLVRDQKIGGLYGAGSITETNTEYSVGFRVTNGGEFAGDISGFTFLVVDGDRKTLTLTGNCTYSGGTLVKAGTLLINGSIADGQFVNVESGGTLGGTGTMDPPNGVQVHDGGHLAPGAGGPGILSSRKLSLLPGANFDVMLNGTAVGTQYSQQRVSGFVGLGFAANLNVRLGFMPLIGNAFTIIDNNSTGGVAGIFDGLPGGAVFTVTSGAFSASLQITYRGGDGNDVVLTVVNTAPTFVAGGNVLATDEDGARVVAGWASGAVAGPAGEAGQSLHYVVLDNTHPELFAAGPMIDEDGDLRFTPAANVAGLAEISLVLVDDGGTALGGSDTSAVQKFTIEVTKPRPWHNTAQGLDVTADGFIAPDDVLAVLSFINAFGVGAVPDNAAIGAPYFDATGDNFVAPNDALAVINDLNAYGSRAVGSEGEGARIASHESIRAEGAEADWLALLAADVAWSSQAKTRRAV